MKAKFYLPLLSILGFSGCTDEQGDMYGVPPTQFHYKGELVDSQGNPIEGIKARFETGNSSYAVKSDDKGIFIGGFEEEEFREYNAVTFIDEDGTNNGGYFSTKKIDIEDTELTYNEWDEEVYDLGVIELEKDSDDEK